MSRVRQIVFAHASFWCVWLTPHFLTPWYQPSSSSFQQMHHHRTSHLSLIPPSKLLLPTDLSTSVLLHTPSPANIQPLLILQLNISSPSAWYQLSTPVSSLCGGFIFSIQTAQIFLSYSSRHHPHRQALILYWLIFDDWIWSCTLCQSKLQFILILPSRPSIHPSLSHSPALSRQRKGAQKSFRINIKKKKAYKKWRTVAGKKLKKCHCSSSYSPTV